MKCVECGGKASKAIYRMMPVKLCLESDGSDPNACNYLWSDYFIVQFLITRIPYNGKFYQYEGSYWKALWCQLTERIDHAE